MTEESLQDKYARLLREGKTDEATKLVTETVSETEDEEDAKRHMVYTDLKGVGEELAEEMYQEFGDWDDFVEEADVESLSDIAGIGEKSAEALLEQVD